MTRLLEELDDDGSPSSRAWAMALRSIIWLAFPAHGTIPNLEDLRAIALEDESAVEGAATCCESLAASKIIAWDASGLAEVAALHESLVATPSSRDLVALEITRSWRSLFNGTYDTGSVERLFATASAEKDAALLVHAASVRALTVACSGDIERAIELSRRASMMGRSEGVPQAEYLAHLVLARVRRMGRQTHRSLRILQALEDLAPSPWHSWISWEKAFAAGDLPNALASSSRPVDAAVTHLKRMLEGALARDRATFARASSELLDATQSCAFAHVESRELAIAMTDLPVPPDLAALAQWADGTTPLLPPALHGFRLRMNEEASAESAAAHVVVRGPGARNLSTRRVLSWGTGLLEEGENVTLPQSRRVEGRIETLVASLALAGEEGRREDDCFAQTYGFEYVAERHRSVFDVLLHRARAFVEEHATLVRENGLLRLVPVRSFLVPDPRCSERVTDRLLRILAQRGQTSARVVAGELGISLRSAQEALSELSKQGACETHREGRTITYVVEDTAFSEPTARLHARQLEEPKGR